VMGPYQLEAAIQSFHTQKCLGFEAPSGGLVALYDNLVAVQPTLGAQVSRVCAIAAHAGASDGLAALAVLDTRLVAQYQPYWAVKAHLSALLKRTSEAKAAYAHAIGLAQSDSVRQYLTRKLLQL
jgi:RNA polymerase sigma-70 factor, ECF subfamily